MRFVADELWDAVLADPRAAGRSPLPIQQRRLSEVAHHLLWVECLRCFRIVEIQKADAVKFFGPHAVWKDVGQRLLDQTCTIAPVATRKMGAGQAGLVRAAQRQPTLFISLSRTEPTARGQCLAGACRRPWPKNSLKMHRGYASHGGRGGRFQYYYLRRRIASNLLLFRLPPLPPWLTPTAGASDQPTHFHVLTVYG